MSVIEIQPVGICRWFDEPQNEAELTATYQTAGYPEVEVTHHHEGKRRFAWVKASRPDGWKAKACIYAGWFL